jgi:hypothetical protein
MLFLPLSIIICHILSGLMLKHYFSMLHITVDHSGLYLIYVYLYQVIICVTLGCYLYQPQCCVLQLWPQM